MHKKRYLPDTDEESPAAEVDTVDDGFLLQCSATNRSIILNHKYKLECGPMPNLMVALLNIGGALCSMPQRLADAHC